MIDSQFFGWVCVERAFAVFTDFPGVSASIVAATNVKSLTTWKAMLPFLLSSWQEPAPHTAAPQIYWVRIMSARSPGNSYNEKHWSQWLLSIASFYEFQWVKQPGLLRESLESWNSIPHPLCKAPSHRAVNGGKGRTEERHFEQILQGRDLDAEVFRMHPHTNVGPTYY